MRHHVCAAAAAAIGNACTPLPLTLLSTDSRQAWWQGSHQESNQADRFLPGLEGRNPRRGQNAWQGTGSGRDSTAREGGENRPEKNTTQKNGTRVFMGRKRSWEGKKDPLEPARGFFVGFCFLFSHRGKHTQLGLGRLRGGIGWAPGPQRPGPPAAPGPPELPGPGGWRGVKLRVVNPPLRQSRFSVTFWPISRKAAFVTDRRWAPGATEAFAIPRRRPRHDPQQLTPCLPFPPQVLTNTMLTGEGQQPSHLPKRPSFQATCGGQPSRWPSDRTR